MDHQHRLLAQRSPSNSFTICQNFDLGIRRYNVANFRSVASHATFFGPLENFLSDINWAKRIAGVYSPKYLGHNATSGGKIAAKIYNPCQPCTNGLGDLVVKQVCSFMRPVL